MFQDLAYAHPSNFSVIGNISELGIYFQKSLKFSLLQTLMMNFIDTLQNNIHHMIQIHYFSKQSFLMKNAMYCQNVLIFISFCVSLDESYALICFTHHSCRSNCGQSSQLFSQELWQSFCSHFLNCLFHIHIVGLLMETFKGKNIFLSHKLLCIP